MATAFLKCFKKLRLVSKDNNITAWIFQCITWRFLNFINLKQNAVSLSLMSISIKQVCIGWVTRFKQEGVSVPSFSFSQYKRTTTEAAAAGIYSLCSLYCHCYLLPLFLSLSLLHTFVVRHLFGCWVSHRQESTESPSIYRRHASHDGRCSSPLCPDLRNRYMRAPAPLLLLLYCDSYELVVLKEFGVPFPGNLKKMLYNFRKLIPVNANLNTYLQYNDLLC